MCTTTNTIQTQARSAQTHVQQLRLTGKSVTTSNFFFFLAYIFLSKTIKHLYRYSNKHAIFNQIFNQTIPDAITVLYILSINVRLLTNNCANDVNCFFKTLHTTVCIINKFIILLSIYIFLPAAYI